MKTSISVGKISVMQYLDFLDSIHGQARLDEFEIRSALGPDPVIKVQRSPIKVDAQIRRVQNEYVFKNNCSTGGYLVTWQDENGNIVNISDMFEEYMCVQDKNDKMISCAEKEM